MAASAAISDTMQLIPEAEGASEEPATHPSRRTLLQGRKAVAALALLAGLVACAAAAAAWAASNEMVPPQPDDWETEDDETIQRFERELSSEDSEDIAAEKHFEAEAAANDVSCGNHRASSCAQCTQGHGQSWCNGDCKWENGKCATKQRLDLTPDNPFGCPKDGGNCQARAGSIHFNFKRPGAARAPTWYYNEIVATHTSSSTYYASNTHGYGYAGIQMNVKDPTHGGIVICSTWDQSAGNARMRKCGAGVRCSGFGGEGTGAKAMWHWNWTVGNRYAWMLLRQGLSSGRVQHTCWFHATELEDKYPGGWKHIATTTSGKNNYGSTFRDGGAFLEQWTHRNSQDLRQGNYGPAYYKNADGTWSQSREARFSPYCSPERVEKKLVRCDYTSSGVSESKKRLYMATGGMSEHTENSGKVAVLDYPSHVCGLPKPLNAFEVHKSALFEVAGVDVAAQASSKNVVCGNHRAASCIACPLNGDHYHGASWCHGSCVWKQGQCMDRKESDQCPSDVSCGGHKAATCGECTQGHGQHWCNGDCTWTHGKCVAE